MNIALRRLALNADSYVYMNSAGMITIETVFERLWKDAGGDLDLFLSCVEDNLILDEVIDFQEAWKDYYATMKGVEDGLEDLDLREENA